MKLDNRKLFDIFRFLLIFTLLGIPLVCFINSNISLYPIELFQAKLVAGLIRMTGRSVLIKDTISYDAFTRVPVLIIDGFDIGVGIDRACTAYRSFYAFFALVVASSRTKWKRKFRGLVSGFFIIGAINILRIFTTSMIGILFGFSFFDITHTILWRYGMLFLVLLLWYIWIKRAVLPRRAVSSL